MVGGKIAVDEDQLPHESSREPVLRRFQLTAPNDSERPAIRCISGIRALGFEGN
jgi:hypothetical protein